MSEYVGVDVSKKRLDVAIALSGEQLQVDNNPAGVAQLVAWLSPRTLTRIVVEASGGWERPVLDGLWLAELPVARVNPGWVRYFARGLGRQAKTDTIDAALLAEYGRLAGPRLTERPSEPVALLEGLVNRRRQLVDMLTQEKNRRHTLPPASGDSLERHIRFLEQEADQLKTQIEALIERTPELKQRSDLLRTAPGVGLIAVATFLARLPELGHVNRRRIAALVGVAPYNDDSGGRGKPRRIAGGRADVRTVLYMITICAIRCNPVIRAFYQHLRAQGKPGKGVSGIVCNQETTRV